MVYVEMTVSSYSYNSFRVSYHFHYIEISGASCHPSLKVSDFSPTSLDSTHQSYHCQNNLKVPYAGQLSLFDSL